ncbi:putative calcium-binding protein [Erysiphe neolycopersici]|uniref:Putative calcium-binding protein n=1 Tax=Erysiphe neolycopersici TaxID=212602 RepID=A0A420HSP0_9PEZI|nr:putative calcium-binding protein [Erysiphe neolycopersici]
MAEDPDAPLLNLTAEEKRLFGRLFHEADSESIGVVTGEAAVKFFEKTRIEPRVLGEIWQIADKENRGLLTPAGFGIVLRLVGHYQAGREPTPELALRPGPLPRFENIDTSSLGPMMKQSLASIPRTLEPQASGSAPIRVPPLTPDKVAQYVDLFESSGGHGGILSGEQAKQVFERAGLPNEVLGRVWSLADTEQKGALEATEFVIAMHLIASLKKGQMRLLPNTLPPGIYENASQRIIDRPISGAAIISSVPRQLSGSSSTQSGYTKAPQLASQTTGSNGVWLITSSDQMKFDSIFNSLDKANRGFITGDQAVPFFSESKLPEDILAQIWDLADINSAGRLSREEFAVAMYLIRMQRSKRDGRQSLPSKLPANLVPPSMRSHSRPTAIVMDPKFDSPVPRSAAEDLFGLDAFSSSTFHEQSTQKIESAALSATPYEINTTSHTISPPISISSTPSNTIKPFIPASSFGQALSQQATGSSKNNASFLPQSLRPQKSLEDLLGDTDAEISKKLTYETSELANLSNQVGSLTKQTQDLQAQKVFLQNESTQSSTKKIELESRLAQARRLYEQEKKEVQNLQEKLILTRNETNKLRIEAEKLDDKLQNIGNEHKEVVKLLYLDQQENSNLKERISLLNSEIAQLKSILENAKLDAKQQKGLVSINQKQLITNEEERDKIKSQVQELNFGKKEDSVGSPISSKVQTPAPGTNTTSSKNSTTNPFFRRIESFSENPFSKVDTSYAESQQSEKLLRNVFGPSFGSPTTNDVPNPNLELEKAKSFSPNSSKTITIPTQATGDSSFNPPSLIPQHLIVNLEPPEASESSLSVLESQPLSSNAFFPADRNLTAQYSDNATNSGGNLPDLSTPRLNIGKILDPREAQTLFTKDETKAIQNPVGDQFKFESLETVRTVKDDFDSAFASFGSTAKAQDFSNTVGSHGIGSVGLANTVGLANEFPPIAELGDDESDSSSEGIGFEDDFATVSSTFDKYKTNIPVTPTQSKEIKNLPLSSTSKGESIALKATSPITDNIFTSEDEPTRSGSLESLGNSQSVDQSTALSRSRLENIGTALSNNEPDSKDSVKSPSSSLKNPLDDEFDDLEDAEEGDSNDEFAKISGTDQSLMNDMNAIFDKSLTRKQIELPPNHSTGDPNQLGNPKVQDISIINNNHDRDSIFPGLVTTEQHLSEPITGLGNVGKASTSVVECTQPGAEASENDPHDDPFLSKLTIMGYQRAEALAALERFDYNLEKAANFLASQS